MATVNDRPVLILGAGINGAALARELVLNRVPVTVVDTSDIGSGTSAYSSRLIHGGLRYLEYGEFDLVRESLAERNRLLTLAPQFVRPLRLFIPATNRFGGWFTQTARFLGLPWAQASSQQRGLYVIRAGLWVYDQYARGNLLPRQSVHGPQERQVPRVTAPEIRWLLAYSDAQIPYVERFVVALLSDAAKIAQEQGVAFEVRTYHEAVAEQAAASEAATVVCVRPSRPGARPGEITLKPAAIVNATGAWVDTTLQRLQVPSDRLMAGTKGSHFVTFRADLRDALRGGGVYTEASDGRPIFILPLGEGVLVGTTDIPFVGDPATAVASDEELDYLVAAVRGVFTDIPLQRSDIAVHYSGVRPLPHVGAGLPAGITRRHRLHWHQESKLPLVSLVGGKLSTCRAFAEQTVAELLPKLGRAVAATSRDRPVGGAGDLRARFAEGPYLAQSNYSRAAVQYAIRNEWATTLTDLVERRLMLLFEPQVHVETLQGLAQLLVEEGCLAPTELAAEVERCRVRLSTHFGRQLVAVGRAA
jgi:glycerol-3-phosphate dehydrogenase